MSSPTALIWFQIFNSGTGQPCKGTTADKVSLSSTADVVDFRDAVKAKNPNKLSSIDAPDLVVYKNKASFDKRNAAVDKEKEVPLQPTESLGGLGTKDDMLIVSFPSPRGASRSIFESILTGKEQYAKRKQPCDEHNDIRVENSKKSKSNNLTDVSNVSWDQVESVFKLTKYVQEQREMDEDQLDFLAKYLSFTTRCIASVSSREAKRPHVIAPVLICVCALFNGDVDMVVEADLDGKFVKAHCHIEFLLRRKNKAICIVEAKKDDFDQGLTMALIGCEVAADIWGLDVSFGIVTNSVQWNFLRSSNDKVEMEECSFHLSPKGPERESLKGIAEKIYAMLSD